ncbi:MAG TPA: 4-(cytidine 5'-diphospho)-2-C-methyl-D-erythritol kinase [Dongiaceae bacterium]
MDVEYPVSTISAWWFFVSMLARAKINLYLHVVGRRADGYHLLDSLIVFAEAGDVVAVAAAGDIGLAIDGPFAANLSADADNLVLRAARGLRDLCGTSSGAAITLTKNLPVASGIGGGSADAAATLAALIALWKVSPDRGALEKLALSLGADVPVCLAGKPSVIGGIGEIVTPAGAIPETHVLLVNPGVATPTPAVFKAREGDFLSAATWKAVPGNVHQLAEALRQFRNDLTTPAIAVTPMIEKVLASITDTRHCLLARLSGSGATCFGLYATAGEVEAARRKIAAEQPDWWAVATRLAVE